MKKIALFGFLLFSGMAFGQINLGTFPVGKWTDTNYDAVWSFTSKNIVIEMPSGGEYYNFDGKTIENFKVGNTSEGLSLSFFCKETQKKYIFIKPLTSMDLIMRIEREGYDQYEVKMSKK